MPSDAHLHFRDLADRDPQFPERFRDAGIMACVASHAEDEYRWTESLRGRGLKFLSSFGIHPQWPVMEHADFLRALAREGSLAAIGEAGFDLYGDRPERIRNPENIATQREAFEFQLGLAIEHGLPLILHVRKALDLVFPYAPRLARLPAVIFHSYSGTVGEGAALLRRGIPAYFSFGAAILNGHKRAIEAAKNLPLTSLLAETDAPWQPPRTEPFCRFEHITAVTRGLAFLRSLAPEEMERILDGHFRAAYPKAAELGVGA